VHRAAENSLRTFVQDALAGAKYPSGEGRLLWVAAHEIMGARKIAS
jgi:hypothetical protein